LFPLIQSNEMRFNCFNQNKSIFRCEKCNLIQLLPQWTDLELEELYKKYGSKEDFTKSKRKIKISKYLLKYTNPKESCFEIGCGAGDNIKFLNDNERNAIGIDKDSTISNPNIVNSDLFEYETESKFDFIYSIHSLEHFTDPKKMLSWISNHLKENGSFLIEVPNVEEPLLSVYKIKEFEKFYWYPYHLFFFSPNTITSLLSNFNLKIKRIQTYGIWNHLRWIFFKIPHNINPTIPIIDPIYKFILTKILKKSDTLLVIGRKQ